MRRDVYIPVANSVPFDPDNTPFVSENVQDALVEAYGTAALQSRSPLLYWEFNSNSNTYLYLAGQTKSNNAPYVVPKDAFLREVGVTARVTTNPSSAFYTIYNSAAINAISLGTLPTVTNQALTYHESDYPYVGSTRVTINLVNNGPSLPLTFSEDPITRIVTIQLATNAGGNITTTATQLRNAFRNNSSIKLIWRIVGTGGTPLTTASIITAGGTVGDAIGSIFLRANTFALGFYDTPVSQFGLISVQCSTRDFGSIADTSVQVTFNFS